MRRYSTLLAVFALAATAAPTAADAPSRIAWYGILEDGLAEAKRSGRPILFVSGAPQCLGVPGIW